jgi:hypothetical protein
MKPTIHEVNAISNIKTAKTAFVFILLTLMAFACKKEDTSSLTKELAKSRWQKTQILISADSILDTIPTIEVFSPTCKSDNIWSFDANNNTFTLDEGASKCDVSDPQIKDQGIIEEQNNGSALRVASDGTNEIWEINSFTSSSFRVSYFGRNASNQLVNFRVTFTKI